MNTDIGSTAIREAQIQAAFSAHSTKVGCVIINPETKLATGGFNEMLGGDGTWLHAEAMAITKAAKNGFATYGCIMGLTWFPCLSCAVLIASSGIKALYYDEPASAARWSDPKYNFDASKKLLEDSGVELVPVVPRG